MVQKTQSGIEPWNPSRFHVGIYTNYRDIQWINRVLCIYGIENVLIFHYSMKIKEHLQSTMILICDPQLYVLVKCVLSQNAFKSNINVELKYDVSTSLEKNK